MLPDICTGKRLASKPSSNVSGDSNDDGGAKADAAEHEQTLFGARGGLCSPKVATIGVARLSRLWQKLTGELLGLGWERLNSHAPVVQLHVKANSAPMYATSRLDGPQRHVAPTRPVAATMLLDVRVWRGHPETR